MAKRKAVVKADSRRKKPKLCFDAFLAEKHTEHIDDVQPEPGTDLVSPTYGIHSLSWANAIDPQLGRLPSLPIEVRHKIYGFVFDDDDNPKNPGKYQVEPRKHTTGKKFSTLKGKGAVRDMNSLARTCRQFYVEVVGGSLLYKSVNFHFTSPKLMFNYLDLINPAHKHSLHTISLDIRLPYFKCLPRKELLALANCHNLRHLTLRVSVLCCLTWASGLDGNSIIPDEFYTEVEKSKGLTEIKGLRSFGITVISNQLKPRGLPKTDHKGNLTRAGRLQEDMRKLLVKN